MNVLKSTSFLLFSITFTWSSYGMTTLSAKEVKVQAAKEAKAIEVEASLSDDHPAIEEGVTCADCHEIKLDAKTTATQVWLTGEYLGFAKNEGAMKNEKVKVLLAEDDKNLGTILKSYLEAKGYPTTLCVNGEVAFIEFNKNEYDFCIVDVMMPVKDGFTLAKEIRNIDKKVPILFLTAKSMQEDKLKGFEIGADDYLTKPFNMEELLARMEAILRRSITEKDDGPEGDTYILGKMQFNFVRQTLSMGEKEVKLTSKEAALLKLLCQNLNEVVDRSLALNKIWFDDSYFNARSMDVYITKLRKYLKMDPTVELINVHGIGFKLVTR